MKGLDDVIAQLRETQAPTGVQAALFLSGLTIFVDENEDKHEISGIASRSFVNALTVDDAITAIAMLSRTQQMSAALIVYIAQTHGNAIAIRQMSLGMTGGKGQRS